MPKKSPSQSLRPRGTHFSHLHHVELEPLEVQEEDVRESGDARALERVSLLVALSAEELVVSREHLDTLWSSSSSLLILILPFSLVQMRSAGQ